MCEFKEKKHLIARKENLRGGCAGAALNAPDGRRTRREKVEAARFFPKSGRNRSGAAAAGDEEKLAARAEKPCVFSGC